MRACAARPADLVSTGDLKPRGAVLSGVVHVHTNLSDGRGSPREVLDAARRSGVDFVVITDHNRTDPAVFDALPRSAGDPLIIAASEVSTEAGHVLAIGIRPPTFRFSGTLREVLDDIRHLGGCAFAAHPTSPRGETRFDRESEPGDWGVEVVNGDTAWREASPFALAMASWSYPANPSFALAQTLGTFETERALWDRLLARRFAPGIGGTDAHGRIPITRTRSVPLPSYDSLFGLVRTVVHLDSPLPEGLGPARAAVVRALCEGRSLVAIPSFADPKGFVFEASGAESGPLGPGTTLDYAPGLRLRVGGAVPTGTRLRLLRDGAEVAGGEGTLDFPVREPGVYRAEAYVGSSKTPWIMANPISLLSPQTRYERDRAAHPAGSGVVEGDEPIDLFDAATAFAPEHDPGSRIDAPILDPSGGRGGRGGAARLAFTLNASEKPPVWCALVDRTTRDLSARTGISFWARADGEYRIWFQLRDLNPRSADEGTEAWFASVRTSKSWTLYNIPFASLRSINRTSDGSFDPSRIAHIVFVVDHGAMPFGAAGKIWIDDLKAYR